MKMLLALNPFDHWLLFEAGLAEFLATTDALVDGKRVPRREVERAFRGGLADGTYQMGLFFENVDAEPLGFNVLSRAADGWLEGHLLYLKPEYRGSGRGRETNTAVLRLAVERGFKGFRFLSTRPAWKDFDVAPHLTQADGTPVYTYSKEVR